MAEPETRADLPSLAIRRPLLVMVLNLLIALAGVAAMLGVEVRELPDVDRPIVSVQGNFPGAAPETMDAEVTREVEAAVARVSGLRSLRSSSEENNFRIRAEFHPGIDLEDAAADVREAVSRVERQLPDGVEDLTVVKADADADPVLRLAVASDTLGEDALTRVADTDVVPALLSVPGVADVSLYGDRERQLRVVVDPLRLAAHGLSVGDVAAVLRTAPMDVPAGSFKSRDMDLIVRADARVATADEVKALVIRDTVRIGDVADVWFGPEDETSVFRLNGQKVIGLGVIRQARSNTIAISDGVRAAVERLNDRMTDVRILVTSDDAVFIKGSVREVLTTLALAVAIVVATLWLFMGSLRTTLIPTVSIPIALVGTVSAIWLLGFSINILTLLALVLATGMIVDDSIVVLENVQRRKAQGLGARAAAVLGTRQVFFAVVATTATLVSVFVPISFLPGLTGRLFEEFGYVLAIAVTISSFVALSLVPALAARLPDIKPSGTPSVVGRAGHALARLYDRSLAAVLGAPLVVLAVVTVFGAGGALLYGDLDRELLPPEDRGVLFISASGPDGANLSYAGRQADHIETILAPFIASGEVERALTIVGRWDPNRVFVIAPLAPWSERARGQQAIMNDLRGPLSQLPGVRAGVYASNSLGLRGSGGGMEVALIGNDYPHLFEAAQALTRAIEDRATTLSRPDISYQPTQPELSVRLDRRAAADLGISLDTLADTLRAMIDGDDLADLNMDDEAIPILLESKGGAINDPGDLANLYVRSDAGALVPLSGLITLEEGGIPAELDRRRQRRAIDIDAEIAPGVPLAEALAEIRTLAAEVLPNDVEMIPLGEAEALEDTGHDVAVTYALALVVVFLVLTAQFESMVSALVVMTTVPFGMAAAVMALHVTGTSLNIYSQIGFVMLIGLMAKNGILVVEFADQLRDKGRSVREAVTLAASVRLRPIIMTMVSTILGGLPLILSTGPGAEARGAIGWVVFGGLGLAALVTLYLTPLAYLGLARLVKPRAAEGDRLDRELIQAATIPDRGEEVPAE
ncbi:efflux RND transporter permease subunit [Roseospira marina]|uniref:Efflux RND transporter permease subunit n=1 Tax=Roseospira marina TaxID=140057 RepID=A0A5M6IAW6_9PROT|nr:efflux RND transporter permease subunit [Roseospira marina]KAA5605262.1 efflux RND transporter permease subunit [Roseospira marina]MBB4314722.1 hydrophobe/amphiphile efflux-1 (HAE1) family protein [Roseospira marina]MBB5087711.1 hydrophobe/amphiphile efflux-1 (HAE1) family protein [Roseospira marina]